MQVAIFFAYMHLFLLTLGKIIDLYLVIYYKFLRK